LDEVYSVTSYHCPMDQDSLASATKWLKHYMPHKPLWTAVGVPMLAEPKMKIEILVKAKSQW
jgi:enamine deaminase RidA (YjgF/YER057c/UK114 family)